MTGQETKGRWQGLGRECTVEGMRANSDLRKRWSGHPLLEGNGLDLLGLGVKCYGKFSSE